MGKLSTSNENSNIMNIIWNAQGLKKLACFSRLNLDSGYTGNIYPLYVSLSGKLKKMEPHIVDMAILLYLITLSITPNDRMNQPFNISSGQTHQI